MKIALSLALLLCGFLAATARADYQELSPELFTRVETVATSNINAATLSGSSTVGGVTISTTGKCALLVAQTDTTQNGVYCYAASTWHTRYMIDVGWLSVLVFRGNGGGKVCTSSDYAQVGMASSWLCVDVRPRFTSAILTGNGSEQSIAHGLGYTPTKLHMSYVGLPSGLSFLTAKEISLGTHDGTNVKLTVPNGFSYMVEAE